MEAELSSHSLHRQDSIISDANSTYSEATSARHMLANVNSGFDSSVALFDSPSPYYMPSTSNVSLSVNYIPSKFSKFRNRKGGKFKSVLLNLPKEGGGSYAFKSNEARMPQEKGRLKWNKFKWVLFVTNSLLMMYSLVALVVCLLIWFDVWEHADVVRVANSPELILSTIAACVGILTFLIGWAGILLNNRGFLAWYTFLTWITFAFLLVPGYLTYKRRTFNLEGKINAQWSRNFDTESRMRVQNQLNCCGYFSPFVEATVSQTCYARTLLPGCKGPFLVFQRRVLRLWYTAVFSLVPAQLLVMVAGLLCSNHITYRFGKGMMPEAYRLNMSTMAIIMDSYANQLTEQYGVDIANDILDRARSTTSLLGSTTTNTLRGRGSPDPDKDPFAYKSASHTGQSMHRVF